MVVPLSARKCQPCEGGVKPFTPKQAKEYMKQVPGWKLDGKKITRQFVFKNFIDCIEFINRMAIIAEGEGHHTDFTVHYRKLDLELSTHAIGGLSENDFILAAKISRLYEKFPGKASK